MSEHTKECAETATASDMAEIAYLDSFVTNRYGSEHEKWTMDFIAARRAHLVARVQCECQS